MRRDAIQSGESTFVPFEAEPSEVGEDGLLGLPGRALEVGVLDAEHKVSPLGAREEVVEERGAGAADVEVAGGRWREADADGAGAALSAAGGNGGTGGERPTEVEAAKDGWSMEGFEDGARRTDGAWREADGARRERWIRGWSRGIRGWMDRGGRRRERDGRTVHHPHVDPYDINIRSSRDSFCQFCTSRK
jgi:hypothetical protein